MAVRHLAIDQSNAVFSSIMSPGMYFNEMLVEVYTFLFMRMHLKCRLQNAGNLLWCQRVSKSLINSKLGLVEVMAWRQNGIIPVLESVLSKVFDTIGGH